MSKLWIHLQYRLIFHSVLFHFIFTNSQTVQSVKQTSEYGIKMTDCASSQSVKQTSEYGIKMTDCASSHVSPMDDFDVSKTLPDGDADVCHHQNKASASHSLAVVPYDESSLPLFHKPMREFDIAGQKIVIKQDWKQLGVAAVVWDAAVVLCEYLERNPDLVKDRTVIELGAGSGIVGIISAYLGGKVTVTERDVAMAYLNAVIKDNIDVEKHSLSVKPLDWTSDLRDFTYPFDVILGADVIYIEDTFDDLLKTFRHLSNEKTVILISCKIRYDRDSKFLDLLRKEFDLKKIFHDKPRDILIYKAHKRKTG